MAMYEVKDRAVDKGILNLTEQHLYGSSRLGIVSRSVDMDVKIKAENANLVGATYTDNFTRGIKMYELTNHLGNVLATISDKKIAVSSNNTIIEYYTADVISAQDYYPGGMMIVGRIFNSSGYRYSINGQEKELELNENITSAEFWEYDSRIVRRWNVDPVLKSDQSSFSCFAGNPIWFADPDGADSTQRANALAKALEYVKKKKPGNQYLMGAKNEPGGKVDCSGLVSKCIKAGDEKDPNTGSQGSGVLNIESNTTKVPLKDVQPGNLITFRNEAKGSYPYHVGIVSEVIRDESGNITAVKFIQSSGGTGPNEKTIPVSTAYGWKKVKVFGFYKWDTKPDKPALQSVNSKDVKSSPNFSPVPSLPKIPENKSPGLFQRIKNWWNSMPINRLYDIDPRDLPGGRPQGT